MIHRVLVPLDPSPYTDTALDYAFMIAKRQDIEITGLVVLDIPGIEHSIKQTGIGGIYWAQKLEENLEAEVRARIKQLVSKFEIRCREAGVKFNTAFHQGTPAERILQESMFYDLIITGLRTFYHFEISDSPGDSLDKILGHSITPVLAVPKKFNSVKQILVAFDGSPASARALQRFVHLAIAQDLKFRVVMSTDDEMKAKYLLDQAESYLVAYGIKNSVMEWTEKDMNDAMREEYLDWADLIVLGAHSRWGILDFFLGSLTKSLILENKKPLFIGM